MRVALVALLVVGCGGEDRPPVTPADGGADAAPDGPAGPIEVWLGSSDGTSFRAVEDGADAELQPGAQGGFHVFIHLRGRGLSAGALSIERTGRRERDGALVTRARDRRMLLPEPVDGGWLQITDPMLTFMCPSPIGVNIIDERIRYEMTITDQAGATGTATLVLVPRCPEGDQREFCLRICKG